MPVLFIYLLKLSVSLAVVFLFYQLLLRRLTFYNSNRWYLLAYTIFSFFIPFVDISLVLHNNAWNEMNIVQWVPVIYKPALAEGGSTASINYWFVGGLFIIAGMVFMLVRLLIQFISFRQMMKKADPITIGFISGDEMKIYQVNDSIIPFSFGNSIFINRHLHTQEELKEIILHEFIHVKQRHSFDITWAEILCLINWYNPFAWLLKKSIRQNLEFIADNKVLENGVSKKEYQYLLLKVTGNNQYSIATQFNFSSLKKRIAMMNKLKSTKRQMLRLLFLLPATAVLLLAFRNNQKQDQQAAFKWNGQEMNPEQMLYQLTDTVPEVTKPNSKGYIINIKDKSGECEIVIKDKGGKEVKRLLLTEWDKNPEQNEAKYGEIPPPPPPPPATKQWVKTAHPDLKSISVNNNLATVTLKNGKKENYDLNNADQKNAFENKYGKLQPPPPPPAAPAPVSAVDSKLPAPPPAPPAPPAPVPVRNNNNTNINNASDNYEITDKKAVIHLRNGKTEEYDLTNAEEKINFESKYGKIVNVAVTAPAVHATVTNSAVVDVQPIKTTVAPENAVVVSPVITTAPSVKNNVSVKSAVDPVVKVSPVAEVTVDIIVTITKNTKPAELDELVKKMKEKGYELKFTNKNYTDGLLTSISGTLKYKDSSSTFSVTDFNKLHLSAFIDDGEVHFNVRTEDAKVRI